MSQPNRRARLKGVRRIPLTVTIDAETHSALGTIGNGNRSAAIEQLVRDHVTKRHRSHSNDPVTAP